MKSADARGGAGVLAEALERVKAGPPRRTTLAVQSSPFTRSRSPSKSPKPAGRGRRASADSSAASSLAGSPGGSRPESHAGLGPGMGLASLLPPDLGPTFGTLVLPPIAQQVSSPSRVAESVAPHSPLEPSSRAPLPPRLSPQLRALPPPASPTPPPLHPPHRLQPIELPDDGAGVGAAPGGPRSSPDESGSSPSPDSSRRRSDRGARRPRDGSVGGAARLRSLRGDRTTGSASLSPERSPSLRGSPAPSTPPRRALSSVRSSPVPLPQPAGPGPSKPSPEPDAGDESPPDSPRTASASRRSHGPTLEELVSQCAASSSASALTSRRRASAAAAAPSPQSDGPLTSQRLSAATPGDKGSGSGSGSGRSRGRPPGASKVVAAPPNSVDPASLARIAAALRTDRTTATLRLAHNELGEEGGAHLAAALRANVRLRALDLYHCGLGDGGAAALAEALRDNSALRELNVARNGVGAEGARALARSLDPAAGLSQLYAEANGGEADELAACLALDVGDAGAAAASGKRAQALGRVLGCNAALRELYAYDNPLGDEGVAALAAALRSNFTVEAVHVANVGMGDAGARALADAVRESGSLVALNVRGNPALTAAGIGALLRAACEGRRILRSISYSPLPPSEAALLAPLLSETRRAFPELTVDCSAGPALPLPIPRSGPASEGEPS